MKRVTAYITGSVQRAGYRGKVIDIARAFGLKGNVQNLEDGRVKVIAEGDEGDLKRFVQGIDIKNTIIHVSNITADYSPATGDYEGFFKLVSSGETDSRLDSAVVELKGIKDAINNMNSNLGGKMDQMLTKQDVMIQKQDQMLAKQDVMIQKQDVMIQKQDQMLAKQDQMLSKQDVMIQKQDQMIQKQDRTLSGQDELLVEVKDMNRSLNEKADQLIKKQDDLVKNEIAEIKTALKARGIM